jgi:hypothetical protein
MALVFFIIFGVLLVLLARETILLAWAILELAGRLAVVAFYLLKLIIMGIYQIYLWYRPAPAEQVIYEEQWQIPLKIEAVNMNPDEIVMVERNGVFVQE